MTWPTTDAGTTNVDAASDNPRLAREDFLQALQNVNSIKNHVSTLMQGMLAQTSKSTARGAIDAQETSAVLDAIKGLTGAANKGIRLTGSGTAETFDISDAAKAALAGADNTAILFALGVVLEDYLTAVEAGETYQPFHALLDSILAVPSGSTGFLAKTGTSTAALRTPVDIQVFTSGSGNWTKPAGAKTVTLYLRGATGGGGSGRRGAAGTNCYGGGGASQPGFFVGENLEASMFAATEPYSVAAAPAGGAAVTANDTDGNDGGDGGNTTFGASSYGFQALGSKGGKKGTATTGTGGAADFVVIGTANGQVNSGNYAGGSSATAAPTSITVWAGLSPTAAGAGGGISSANVAFAGQNGQGIYNQTMQTMPNNGATGGANTGAAGANGAIISLGTNRWFQCGGAGGGANLTGAGGAGGVPGGGGGASRNGNNSGAGGAGLAGLIVVITHCGV